MLGILGFRRVVVFTTTFLLAITFVITHTPFILATVLPVVPAIRPLLLPIIAAVLARIIRDEQLEAVDVGGPLYCASICNGRDGYQARECYNQCSNNHCVILFQ